MITKNFYKFTKIFRIKKIYITIIYYNNGLHTSQKTTKTTNTYDIKKKSDLYIILTFSDA